MLHGDGEMLLLNFEYRQERLCYVVFQRDISSASYFEGYLQREKYWDWETPYGYGGPLSDSVISEEAQEVFKKDIFEYCKRNNIVSQFIRFNPLTCNQDLLSSIIETKYLRDTIYIDTTSREIIWKNLDSKNRNMIRKAINNGIQIVRKDIVEYEDFLVMYNETMRKNDASDYYYFEKKYFDYLSKMSDNAFILYALYEGRTISGSIMFYNNNNMHYHLSGSRNEYRNLAPSNLLLYEAACIASDIGVKHLHLGGGITPNDSLFGFKKQFNKEGRLPFVVGRTVFCEEAYEELLNVRKSCSSNFIKNNNFMIQYRYM